jgi:hypothetical protein
VHIAGARRHRWRCRERAGDERAGPGLRSATARTGAGDVLRSQPPGSGGTGHGSRRARLFRRRRDPADAHARSRRHQRSAAAFRTSKPASRSRSVSRAAVCRTAGPGLMGGRRQPSADQRRYFAADAAGGPATAAAHSRIRNLAVAGAGAADGSCRERAARGRRRLFAQSDHVHRTLHRSNGPRHRRPGHRADSRAQRVAPGTCRDDPAAQGVAGGNRNAARLRRCSAVADLGQARRRRAVVRQCRLCAGDRGRQCHRRGAARP